MTRPTLGLALVSFLIGCDCSGVAGYRHDGGELDAGEGSGVGGGAGGGGGVGGGAGGGGGVGGGAGGGTGGGGTGGGGTGGGADAGALDPATCPLGVADGCCSLLVHGGTDPDCPSLGCSQLDAGAVIDLLGDSPDESWKGATALAWTGSELVLVRTDAHVDLVLSAWVWVYEVVFERRAPDGTLLATTRTPVPSLRATPGTTSLAFDPVTRSFLFAYSGGQSIELVALDDTGAQRWNAHGHQICNAEDGIVQVEAAGGRFFVTGNNFTCAGSTGVPVVYAFDAGTGASLYWWYLGEGGSPLNSWASSAACDLGCRHILTQWYPSWEGILHGRTVDTALATGPDAGFSMTIDASYGGIDHSALASNGSEFFSMVAITTSSTGSSTLSFQRHDGTQWLGTPITLGGQRALPPSAIWTGDGWLIAATTVTANTSNTNWPGHPGYSIVLYHFAADGSLREVRLFEDRAYGARLAWAGGRIAMTITRVPASGTETRHLLFLGCP